MDEEKDPGLVALSVMFDDLLKAEEAIQKGSAEPESENLKRGIAILKKIKKRIVPLERERDYEDLEYILDDLESAIDSLSGEPDPSKAMKSLKSAEQNLMEYNMTREV